jgi:hypothetical protein
MASVILIVHYDAYITKFSVPLLLLLLMYHNCLFFFNVWFVGWAGLEETCRLTGDAVPLNFHGSFLSITLKNQAWFLMTFIIAYHLLHYRGHACSYHLPKPSCENLSNKFLIALVSSQSCIGAAFDPYQKFNPITKELFRLVYSLTLSLKGLSLTGYLCEFVCTSGYLPPQLLFTECFL